MQAMANVWTRMLHSCGVFFGERSQALRATSFASPSALLDSLINGAQPDTKPALQSLHATLGDGSGLAGANKTLWDGIAADIAKQKTADTKIATKLAVTDFGFSEAKDVGSALGDFVSAGIDAIGKIAKNIGGGNATVENAVNSNMEPWADGLRNLAGDKVPAKFDELCKTVLDINSASSGLWHHLELDLSVGRLKIHLAAVGEHGVGPVNFDGAEIEAFIQFKPPVLVGVALVSKIKAGLRSGPTMNKIIPSEAPTADTADAVALQLDTDKGFSLGSGNTQRVVLPVRFAFPFIELREFAISSPNADKQDAPAQIDFTTVVAGKFGSVLSFVCEGGGVSLVSVGGDYTPQPKLPDGLGIRFAAGPVVGGGFLRHDPVKNEYGGALQLTFADIGVTAIGLIQPDTMALLVVLGVHFPAPGIQLGFGFTLDAVGGLVASDRRLDIDQLSAKLKDGAVSNILLPDDPVASAPTILDQLSTIFPPQAGAFVVGPMVELGWGGQSGLVTARVGVLIALPDPSVTILVALLVLVPPKIVEKAPRIVELNIDVFASIDPDEFFLKATLRNSKIAGLVISGDLALLIRWAADSALAFSAGGFFPTYKYPPKLAGLQRLMVQLAPPVDWMSLKVTGYIAVTGNSIQFGGAVDLAASVGPASGEAHLSLDAMFVFSPRFAFIVEFNASVAINAFGQSIAGAAFRGTVSGTAPWSVVGAASVKILWWDVDFDIGPIEWGDHDVSELPLIDSIAEVTKAFNTKTAWSALSPAVSDAVTILKPAPSDDDETLVLLQPFSLIQAKQDIAPFDIDITRLGAYASTIKQFNFANPQVNGVPAPAYSEVQTPFAIGQFKELNQDEKASKPDFENHVAGLQIAPTTGIALGRTNDATLEWDTFYPHTDEAPTRGEWALSTQLNRTVIAAGAVARQLREVGNPYAPSGHGPVEMADAGTKIVVPLATAKAAASVAMTTTEADLAAAQANVGGEKMQVVSMGLAA
jgi:hypothetical protein